MLKSSLRGQIRQTNLPKWRPLLPLFEAVMNAVQAAHDVPDLNHLITIEITRDPYLLEEEDAPIESFHIEDRGIGLNEDNFDSFNTAFSEHKEKRGGKGLGRFIWLKAFDYVQIKSVFNDANASTLKREFRFDSSYDPDKVDCSRHYASIGTKVSLIGFKEPYKSACPRGLTQITQRMIEHFILVFLQTKCPKIEILDNGKRVVLNDIFESEFRRKSNTFPFQIHGSDFSLHGFRLETPRVSKHKLIYAANSRGVLSEGLEADIPNMNVRLIDSDSKSFIYLAVVQSSFLDQKVNNLRTDFQISLDNSKNFDQEELFSKKEITKGEIHDKCIECIRSDLSEILLSMNEDKEKRLFEYVHDEAPHYNILLRNSKEFIDKIPPNASKAELDTALHKELHQKEVKLKQESNRVIKEAEKLSDYESYRRRLTDFVANFNELGVSALAQHVAHRKIILDFLERAISKVVGETKYPLESAVHNIIFPMKHTVNDLPYYQHNLWIIDEALTYHSYISSDKPLDQISVLDNQSKMRPDIFIFDRRAVFTEGDQPLNMIAVVEFKKPMRDDYKADDNPLTQTFNVVEEIRNGTFRDEQGRELSVAHGEIPTFCYVICDITKSLKKVMLDMEGAQRKPNNQGFYGYHSRRKIYYEVMDYNELLRNAQKRNRVFFEKLNIPTYKKC